MERLLRPTLDRWMLVFLLVLSLAANLYWWDGESVVAAVLNVILGVASGYACYGVVLLAIATVDMMRTRR